MCLGSLSEEVPVEFFWQLFRRCGRKVTLIFLQRRVQVARARFSIRCSTVFHSTSPCWQFLDICHVSICWLVDFRSHCKMLRMCSPPTCETGASFVVELRLQWAGVPRAGPLWVCALWLQVERSWPCHCVIWILLFLTWMCACLSPWEVTIQHRRHGK